MSVVPITRELLAAFYDKHPYAPPPAELKERIAGTKELSETLANALPDPPFAPPYRLDDCFWRNRQLCEEIIANLSRILKQSQTDSLAEGTMKIWDKLKELEESVRKVQQENSDQIATEVKKFLPKDFRSRMIEGKNLKREKKRQQQVDKLVKSGASVTEKYELLLKHQAERRKGLVELGQCKGVFRWMVRHVAGVPKVLLDFAKEINAKLGPMEEQRIRYGPHFYAISELGTELWVLSYVWAKHFQSVEADNEKIMKVLEMGVDMYCQELDRLTSFICEMFKSSPWFVSPDAIKPIEVKKGDAEGDSGLDDVDDDDDDDEVSENSQSDAAASVSKSAK